MNKRKLIEISKITFYVYMLCLISIINAQEPNNSDKKIEVNSNPNKTDINLIDSALDLDGNESYLEIIDSNSLNNITKEVTVSLWIKPTAYPHEYANILFKGNRRLPGITHRQFTFWLWDDGRISFDTSPAGKFAQFIVPDNIVKLNTWTFIGGVIDVNKDVMKVFINGEEVERRSFRNETHILKTTLPLRIGRSHEEERPCHSPFIGQIDDVSVWNIARSNEEIRSDMISKPTGTENGLIGYWNFDNVENGVIQDLSPNQNHGKMFGNAYLIKYIKPRTRIGIDNITDVSILYEEFLKSEANYYDGYRYLAETYNMLKRNSDAEKVYMRSLNVDLNQNEYTDALINLRKLFIDRGANTEFIKLLEDFKGHMFNSSVYYDLLGDAYLFENMKEMAESSYRNWVELSKDNVNEVNRSKVYNRISEKLLRNNLLPEIALELSEIAVENQIDPSYHITLIKAYIANQLYNEVIQHIKFHRNLFSNKYYEDQIYLEFLTAGRGIDDKDAYIEMLSQLIDEISYPQTLQHKFIFTLAKYYSENDMIEKSNSIIQSTGYIIDSAWMLLGPFDSDNVSGINNIFINEHLPRMDFSSQYDGKYGKVIWKEHALEVVDNIIEMPEVVRRGIYYAYSTINSPEEQDVIFEFAVSDFSKVWVNGLLEFEIQHIEQRNVNNSAFPITLYQGNNSILVKVFEEGRGRGFSLQVTDLNGNTVDNLKILYPNE